MSLTSFWLGWLAAVLVIYVIFGISRLYQRAKKRRRERSDPFADE